MGLQTPILDDTTNLHGMDMSREWETTDRSNKCLRKHHQEWERPKMDEENPRSKAENRVAGRKTVDGYNRTVIKVRRRQWCQ